MTVLRRRFLQTAAATPADFGKMIADETEKPAKVVRFSGNKVE